MDHILSMFYKGLHPNQWFFKLLCLEGHDDPWVWILEVQVCFRESTFLCNFLSAKSIIKVTVLKIALMPASFFFSNFSLMFFFKTPPTVFYYLLPIFDHHLFDVIPMLIIEGLFNHEVWKDCFVY